MLSLLRLLILVNMLYGPAIILNFFLPTQNIKIFVKILRWLFNPINISEIS